MPALVLSASAPTIGERIHSGGHGHFEPGAKLKPHRAEDKLPWALSESCTTFRVPKKQLRNTPMSQVQRPTRQTGSRSANVPAWTFGGGDSRFELGAAAISPGSELHRKALSASAKALRSTGTPTVQAKPPSEPAKSGESADEQSEAAAEAAAEATVGEEQVPAQSGEASAATESGVRVQHDEHGNAKVHGEIRESLLDAAGSTPGPKYDVKTPKDMGCAPKYSFGTIATRPTRAKPEWKGRRPGPLDHERADWLQSFGGARPKSADVRAPRYSFGSGRPSNAPSVYGRAKTATDFGEGAEHDVVWKAPGAIGRQADSRRPSSAACSFGRSHAGRFGADPELPLRACRAGGAAAVSGLKLDPGSVLRGDPPASAAAARRQRGGGGVARRTPGWSMEERGCLEGVGRPGSNEQLRLGRNAPVTPQPGEWSADHSRPTGIGRPLVLSTHKSRPAFSLGRRSNDNFQGSVDHFPGPGYYF